MDFDDAAEMIMFPSLSVDDLDTDDMDDDDFFDRDDFDESMDGDHESALASAGFGTDEDYGDFGGDDW